jgi:adenosylcobinamide-GDP ribazoletransferase
VIAQLAAAIGFLTRLPAGSGGRFSAKDVARSARWFPLVGALIGGCYAGGLRLSMLLLPPLAGAALVLVMEALLTGALHLDGLADAADGFGGGRTREEVLRIMRDHAIGSYGATALILVIALKVIAIAGLAERRRAGEWLILAAALGRWSAVLLSATLPYARRPDGGGGPAGGAVADFVGRRELAIATGSALALAAALGRRGACACALAAAASAWWGRRCRRRIGGVTGDTLGAGVEVSETLVLLLGLAFR